MPARSEHTGALEKKAGDVFAEEVLDVLSGEDEVDRRVGDLRHRGDARRDPLDVVRQNVRFR